MPAPLRAVRAFFAGLRPCAEREVRSRGRLRACAKRSAAIEPEESGRLRLVTIARACAPRVTRRTPQRRRRGSVLARVCTFAIDGLSPRPGLGGGRHPPGPPAFTIVGLGDAAVREARERVRAAIDELGLRVPAAAHRRQPRPGAPAQVGPGFDLAIACAVLAPSEQLPPIASSRLAVFGELSLGGEVRAVPRDARGGRGRSARPASTASSSPPERAGEAALVDGPPAGGRLRSPAAACRVLAGLEPLRLPAALRRGAVQRATAARAGSRRRPGSARGDRGADDRRGRRPQPPPVRARRGREDDAGAPAARRSCRRSRGTRPSR